MPPAALISTTIPSLSAKVHPVVKTTGSIETLGVLPGARKATRESLLWTAKVSAVSRRNLPNPSQIELTL